MLVVLTLASIVVIISWPPHKSPPVGVFLYLWYGDPHSNGGPDSPGWNGSAYPGGGAVVDRPAIGYYSSDDNQTFAWQVAQMQRAGFSFAVLSWWGPYTEGESGAINAAARDFFSFLKFTDSTFKAAIMVDAYNGSDSLAPSNLKSDYNYVYDSFVRPYGNWYFNWEDKPLLLLFNPIYPSPTNDSFTIRTIGNRPNPVDWTFWDAPKQFFQSQGGGLNATNDEGLPTISRIDGEVTIVPRIDSYFNREYQNESYLRFDSNLTQGLYQEQWEYVIAHKSSVSLVLIYSWNEYHERTAVEPHADFTANVNQTYLSSLTANYISELH